VLPEVSGGSLLSPISIISEQISRRQSQVDRLYVALKELGEERRVSLEQQYWLYQLSRQVDELEHWIAEKEVVAGSPELGQDFEHVSVRILIMLCCLSYFSVGMAKHWNQGN
jgi:hypothetical protein